MSTIASESVRLCARQAPALLDHLFWLAAHRAIGLGRPVIHRIEVPAHRFPVRPRDGWSAPRTCIDGVALPDAILARLDGLERFASTWREGLLPFDPVAHGVGVTIERGGTDEARCGRRTGPVVLDLRFRRDGPTLSVCDERRADGWALTALAGLLARDAVG